MATETEKYTVWSIPMDSWDSNRNELSNLTDTQKSEISNECRNISQDEEERIKSFESHVTDNSMMQFLK